MGTGFGVNFHSVLPETCVTLSVDWNLMPLFGLLNNVKHLRLFLRSNGGSRDERKDSFSSFFGLTLEQLQNLSEQNLSMLIKCKRNLKVLVLELPSVLQFSSPYLESSFFFQMVTDTVSELLPLRVLKVKMETSMGLDWGVNWRYFWHGIKVRLDVEQKYAESVGRSDMIVICQKLIRLKSRLSSDIKNTIEFLDGLGWEIVRSVKDIECDRKRELEPHKALFQSFKET